MRGREIIILIDLFWAAWQGRCGCLPELCRRSPAQQLLSNAVQIPHGLAYGAGGLGSGGLGLEVPCDKSPILRDTHC